MSMRVLLQVEIFLANVVNYGSFSNKNSTDIKLGNFVVNVLYQFLAKYYLLNPLNTELNSICQ